MQEFDPFESEFDLEVDPITADQRGLAILDKLEEGENMRGEIDPAEIDEGNTKLLANLERYKEFKQARGEDLFSYQEEAELRSKGFKEENVARQTAKIFQADDETFRSFLSEQGDAADFDAWESFMPEGESLKSQYLLKKTMQSFGFSEREIRSGFAEPQFREMVKAGEHEPTEDAALRWGLDRVNVFDRRNTIAQSANTLATNRFLGLALDESTFEKELNEANPDLSNEERTMIRRVRNNRVSQLESKFGQYVPAIKRALTTLTMEEGVESPFQQEGVEPFESIDDAARFLSKAVPQKDFHVVVAMMAKSAENFGQDVDSVMAGISKSFTRGAVDLLESSGEANLHRTLLDARTDFQAFQKGIANGQSAFIRTNSENITSDLVASEFLIAKTGFGPKLGTPGEDPRSGFDRGVDNIIVDPLLGFAGAKRTEFKEVPPEVMADVGNAIERIRQKTFFGAELRNWREAVAKVEDDNIFINDWVYGTARSLPEMGAAFGGFGGMSLVANAQTGRNLAEINRRDPNADPVAAFNAAEVAGLGYAMLNHLEGKILFGKMPKVKSLMGRFAGKVGLEVLQETAQDAMLPLTLKLYSAIHEDMPDVNLFGEGGEINALIKRAPRTAFAVVPIVASGMGGSAAAQYFNSRSLRKIINDSELMAAAGFDPQTIEDVKKLPIAEAAQRIQEGFSRAVGNIQEQQFRPPPFGVTFNPNPDQTMTVTDGNQAIITRSSEEAVEAAIHLDPQLLSVESSAPVTSTSDATIDPNFQDSLVFHSFIAPGFGGNTDFEAGEAKSRRKDALPPIPDAETGSITKAAKRRFGLQSFLGQRNVPSKTLQRTLDEGSRLAQGVESQFTDIAKSLSNRVKRHVKAQPAGTRDSVFKQTQSDAYLALRGDDKAMKRLPAAVQSVVATGRSSIDAYSQRLIETGAVANDLADKVSDNIGTYVTREFKVFDPEAKWNYQTVKKQHPEIYQNALKEIMSTAGVDVKEADTIVRGLLDSSKSQSFYSGTGTIGKVNVTSFIKRKDLSDPILDLLGEVRNPVVNIKNTGTKLSKIATTHAAQAHMAEQLIAAGLASRKPNPDKRHTERLGEETYSFPGVDENTGEPVVMKGTRTAKGFAGFGTLYLEPELHGPLTKHFNPGLQKDTPGFQVAFNALAKVTGIGKFAQVILNPAAYPTNFLGGVATEILNGRISLNGARAYFKSGSFRDIGKAPNAPYGVTDQIAFHGLSGKAFLEQGGVKGMNRNQFNTEMQQQGIRDNSVYAQDLQQTIDIGYGESVSKTVRTLSKAYQATDNAAKRSAFANELTKWAKAEPTKTMDELIQLAAEDVRLTTQNYDMVPSLLKAFSQRGVIVPTYISFSFELFRNTINTAKLTAREIRSDNAVIRASGYRRAAGMAIVGGLLYSLNEMASEWMSGLDDDEREKMRAALPPWLDNSEVVFLGADEKTLAYFDASYLIPHQVFYNAVSRAFKAPTAGEKFTQSAKAIVAPVGGLNIFNQTVAEVLTNQKRGGGKIYNEAITPEFSRGYFAATGGHFYESMFTPGVLRTLKKFRQAEKGEVGFAGATATMDDIAMGLIGVRPYRMDTSSDAFLEDNLINFSFSSRTAKSHTSDRKQARRTESEKEEAEEAVTKAQKRLLTEFSATVKMFKTLNISDERIQRAVREVSVPRYMRSELPKLLAE